ncbi:hypothetical protein [Streptomyces sp. NPDC055243]|uniref:hypothetical protein n=1 Tax=Streptomyces sp. NPDC055243 TaxID=3365720 RepID=UPI0037CFEE27
MALHIDWTEHDNLSPREAYDAAGKIIDEAKTAVAARRDRIAHDLLQEHGAEEAATTLGISKTRVYGLAARYRDAQPEIFDNFPGRQIASYDLLDEVMDQYGLGKREAHEAIHAYLQQLVDLGEEGQVVIAARPARPELLKDNPQDLDVRYWYIVRAETVDEIREALTLHYAAE